MREQVAVIGTGAVPIGKYEDVPEHELLIEALQEALKDAGIDKDDVGWSSRTRGPTRSRGTSLRSWRVT